MTNPSVQSSNTTETDNPEGQSQRALRNTAEQAALHEYHVRDYDLHPIPEGISQMEAALLARYQIVLFATASEESQRAFRAIENAQISFRVVASPDADFPIAEWGANLFHGIEEIEGLLAALSGMKARLLAGGTRTNHPSSSPRDQRRAQWMKMIYDRQLEAANNVMREIQLSQERGTRATG